MSEMIGEPNQGPQVGNNDPQGIGESQSTGMNPAWNDLLGVVPNELHSQVTPHLTKWDQGVQQKIQQVHSQYEPYKFLIDEKIQPDQVNYAMGVLQAIETNPQEVLTALQSYIGANEGEQGQNQQSNGSETEAPEWLNHPEFKQLQEMTNTMAQYFVQQRQTEEQARVDQEMETEIKTLKDELGEFDEEWVLTKMMSNDKLQMRDAVTAYKEFEQGILTTARQPGPKIMSSGGSVPNQGLDVKALDSKGKRNLVAQMLQNAKHQNL